MIAKSRSGCWLLTELAKEASSSHGKVLSYPSHRGRLPEEGTARKGCGTVFRTRINGRKSSCAGAPWLGETQPYMWLSGTAPS
jgi:hypothetical protein